MKTISVFYGSTRQGRNGDNVAEFISKKFEEKGYTVNKIDPNKEEELQKVNVPFHFDQNPSETKKKIHDMLESSDGFILVSPEYNHSYSGAIKNSLDNFMPEYSKKPFGIVTYSAGPFGGIRANEALRNVVSELKGVPTPLPFMISKVQDVFGEDGSLKDDAYSGRFDKFFEDFDWYVEALTKARKDK